MRIARVLLVAIVLACFSTVAAPTGFASEQTGPISFPGPSLSYYCITNVDDYPRTGFVEIEVPLPRVGVTATWPANTPQLVSVKVTGFSLAVDGRWIPRGTKTFTDTATSELDAFGGPTFITRATLLSGDVYRFENKITWFEGRGKPIGTTTVSNQTPLRILVNGAATGIPANVQCIPPLPPVVASTGAAAGTVNSALDVRLQLANTEYGGTVIQFDGKTIPAQRIARDPDTQFETARVHVPAAPAGSHVVTARRSDGQSDRFTYTIQPRIKITPSPSPRGSTVDVSLRGYGAGESVRIRWFDGLRYVTLATVVTSNTGSKNVSLAVPLFAPNGFQKVRGDGTVNAAQTNAFKVDGGPKAAMSNPKLTATATATAIPSATLTPTAEPSATLSPTVEPTASPIVEPTMDVTTQPSPEVSPQPSATTEPTGEPPVEREPTATATFVPEATGASTPDATTGESEA